MDHTFADLHQHVPFSGPKPIPSLSPRAAATPSSAPATHRPSWPA